MLVNAEAQLKNQLKHFNMICSLISLVNIYLFLASLGSNDILAHQKIFLTKIIIGYVVHMLNQKYVSLYGNQNIFKLKLNPIF